MTRADRLFLMEGERRGMTGEKTGIAEGGVERDIKITIETIIGAEGETIEVETREDITTIIEIEEGTTEVRETIILENASLLADKLSIQV